MAMVDPSGIDTRARFKAAPGGDTDVKCGNCGGFLITVSRLLRDRKGRVRPNQDTDYLDFGANRAWRFDDGIWRPTQYHKTQRQRSRDKLNDPNLSHKERSYTKFRLWLSLFERRDRHRNRNEAFMRIEERLRTPPWEDPAEKGLTLPTKMECPRCAKVNYVDRVDSAQR